MRKVAGVRGVTSQIGIRQRVSPQVIQHAIAAALARHARREAKHIAIEVEGGVVTLRGTVDSMAEHDAAIGTAGVARGVSRVVDQLRVGG